MTVFQIGLTLTFDDSTRDECLVEILTAYRDLGQAIRAVHGCMLLQSVGCRPNDERAIERFSALLPDPGEMAPEQRRYARDILTLAAIERGEMPRFQGDPPD